MLAIVKESIAKQGFAVVPRVLTKAECEELIEQLGPASGAGRRGILEMGPIAKLSRSDLLLNLVQPHLFAQPRPVRGIYFDKTADTNWLVTWHQDLTIAVRAKIEVAGFGSWSMKDGVPHVQPPVSLLEQMITVRLHLDDCDESNGALQVIGQPQIRPPFSRRHPANTNSTTRYGLLRCCRRCSADAAAAVTFLRPFPNRRTPPCGPH
ncbi:MAG TPA: phytanoyl-CoA dioxygenase family protein [Verrucomicrobiae bacterium]|nr:phytanoyl-CoA dioxygenase family protein [Verrucomicrobiae bacterium]